MAKEKCDICKTWFIRFHICLGHAPTHPYDRKQPLIKPRKSAVSRQVDDRSDSQKKVDAAKARWEGWEETVRERDEGILAAYESGKTRNDVAEEFGVSPFTVRKTVLRLGGTMRDGRRAQQS